VIPTSLREKAASMLGRYVVILDAEARGSTTVFTADPIAAATIATPATTAKIRSASTLRMVGGSATPRWR